MNLSKERDEIVQPHLRSSSACLNVYDPRKQSFRRVVVTISVDCSHPRTPLPSTKYQSAESRINSRGHRRFCNLVNLFDRYSNHVALLTQKVESYAKNAEWISMVKSTENYVQRVMLNSHPFNWRARGREGGKDEMSDLRKLRIKLYFNAEICIRIFERLGYVILTGCTCLYRFMFVQMQPKR